MSRAAKWILTLQDMGSFGLPMELIIGGVCKALNVGRRDLHSPQRNRGLVEARHIFYWFARMYTTRSYPEIGHFINRDHGTVIHGVRKIDANILRYMPKLRAVASEIGVNLYDRKAA